MNKGEEDIKKRLDRLANVNISCLPPNEKDIPVLQKLIEASKLMDEIFLRQVYRENPKIRDNLLASKDIVDKMRLEYFMWNKGPWDRLDGDKPFIGNEEKNKGAEFYPTNMTKEEFESWIKEHPEDEKLFKSYYTVIRRKGDELIAVPYSEEYKEFLEPASKLLREAAELSENKSLKKFLLSRAEAFLSNDYSQSEVDWIKLDSDIEITIGPYEVYEDGLFGYKASFESCVTIKDREESEKLKIYAKHLKEIDSSLPIDKKFKFTKKSQTSPISVVTEIFTGGDASSGYRFQAFNLPNDEKIREKYGSKKVLLKNIMKIKFDELAKPLGESIIDGSQVKYISFDSHFNFVLFHELSHGIGPGQIILDDGPKVTVNDRLKELYNPLEEAKADIAGLYCAQYFMERGVIEKKDKELYVTYLNNLFRLFRLGLNEAHGKAGTVEYNYLKERGAISFDKSSEKFKVEYGRIKRSVPEFLKELLDIQAEGSYENAQNFLDAYGHLPKEVEDALGKIENIKVDINPHFSNNFY